MAKYLDSVGLEHLWGELKLIIGKKADVSSAVSNVVYDTLNKKLTKTIGDSVTDIVTTARLKTDLELTKSDVGLSNVDNTADEVKSVASAVTAQALFADPAKPTTANEMHTSNVHRLRAFLATSAMTVGKPPVDSHVLHFNWETGTANTGTRDSQLAISSGSDPRMYFRTQNNGVWSDWTQLYSSANLPSYTDVGLDKVQNLTQKALHGGNALIRRANLNNVTDVGNYYAITDSIANTLVNSPTNKAFHMYVGLSTGEVNGYEYQEVIEAESGARYYRRRQGSEEAGWTDWTTITENKAGVGLGLADNAFYTKVFPATEDTTKRLTALGASKYIFEEYPLGSEDLPTEHNYFVLTATGANVRYGAQLAMCKNADRMYFRRIYNSVYGDWMPLVYKAGNGLSLDDGTFTNIGVLSVLEGTQNGTIKVNTNGTTEVVPIHGLGNRAFDNTEYLPIAGGTLTGTVTASRSGQIGFEAENTNANNRHKVSMIAGSTGSAGLYDNTFSKWIAYADKNGNVILNGNAAAANEFTSVKSIELTGDVTGSASSKGGWSISTTLANTAVGAGSYGPSSAGGLSFGSSFSVPYITVDAKGRITGASTKSYTLPSLAATGVTAGTYGPTSSKSLSHSDTFTVPYYKVDEYGRITSSINRTLTLPSFDDTGVDPGSYGQSADASPSHGGTIRIPYFTVNAKGQITKAYTRTITLPEDKNTVYTAGDGLVLRNGEFSNTGVRTLDISTGSSNGTIGVSINGGASLNVFVKGLDTAAYRSAEYFALAGHTHYYAGSSSVGGAADSVANDLVIRLKSGTSEGSTQYTFNGSRSKTLNIKEGDNITLTTSSGSLTIKAKDTTYSAGTGITLSSSNAFSLTSGVVTAGSAGPTADVTGNDNATINVPHITVDTYGRVTGLTYKTYTSKDTHHVAYLRAGASGGTTNYPTSNGATYLNLVENGSLRSGVKISGDTDILVTSSADGAISIKTRAIRTAPTTTTSVNASSWTSTTNSYISGVYPYQAFVSVSSVDSYQYPDVTFKPSDIETWELGSICMTAAGGVYIYSKKKPTSAITILSMRFF